MSRILTGICVLAMGIGVALSPGIAQTFEEDPAALAERLRKVERELRDLQYQLRSAEPAAVAPGQEGSAPVAATPQAPIRYDDLEQSLRRLTGEVEEMSFQVKRLQDQYATFQKDTQFRLNALEGGAPSSFPGMSAPAAPATPGGPAPMALPGGAAPPATPPKPSGGTLGTLPATAVPALAAAPGSADPNEQYKAALNLLSKQQYGEAQTAFRSFAAANPKHELAATAQFFAADIDFVQKNYPAAAQGFTALLRAYPKAPRAPDAMLKLGLSLIQAGDKKNGCLALGAIKQKYPSANGDVLNRAGRARVQAACA
jgi:tol-pal system protein YbgF